MLKIMFAAMASDSGKTSVTCGMLALLARRGLDPCAFKCGPDYIDPMFHRSVIGVPSHNIDLYMCSKDLARNMFERYSAGHGAAVVEGVQAQGVSACPKHFACNNQEMRRNTSDSQVSERALREIYLRGFQICVRDAKPWAIMTSYNKINGVWAHYNYDRATTVLRNEWGFAGVVITDWWMRPSRSPEFPELRDNAYRVRAGVDVLMPGSMSHVLNVFEKPRGITRAELQRTACHVLGFCLLLAKR